MKRILLTTGLGIFMAVASYAQVIFAGVSPASIEGNYDFTWADPGGGDWSTPDFNIPGTYVQGELMIVDDGSTGTNPQGNPVSAEGCNPLVNDLTGKVAVIYRNTCEFGTKALNAENAGAIGVVIINREDELVNMGGGNDGFSVTIPVVFIQASDGATLVNEMANGPVTVFMGNRAGLYANDLSASISHALIAKAFSTPTQLAMNDGEIAFDIGLTIYNYGYADQDSAMITATIEDPSGSIIYDETVGPFAMTAVDTNGGGTIDSVIVLPGEATEFPSFTLNSPTQGRYTVSYSVYNGSSPDDFEDDNTVTSDFLIDENFSYCEIDENGVGQASAHYRPAGSYSSYAACVAFVDSNASRIGVDGLWFQAAADDSLTNAPFYVSAYKWSDVFDDLDDPNLDFLGLELLETVTYTFAADSQEVQVYAEFENDIPLEDGQRYLFCVKTFDPTHYIGFDTRTQYLANQELYRQPMGIVEVSEEYDAIGFGADVMPSIVLEILDSSEVVIPEDTTPDNTGIEEKASFQLNAYPNPTKDHLVMVADVQGQAQVNIVDITGKVVMTDNVTFAQNRTSLNTASLSGGVYLIQVIAEDGRLSQTRIIKQ